MTPDKPFREELSHATEVESSSEPYESNPAAEPWDDLRRHIREPRESSPCDKKLNTGRIIRGIESVFVLINPNPMRLDFA